MYSKLVVFVAIMACASSAPSGVVLLNHQPLLTQTVVGSAPATISKTSSSVVHSAAVLTPSVQLIQKSPVLVHAPGVQLVQQAPAAVQIVQQGPAAVQLVQSPQLLAHSAVIGSVPSTISQSSSSVVHSAAVLPAVPQIVATHGW